MALLVQQAYLTQVQEMDATPQIQSGTLLTLCFLQEAQKAVSVAQSSGLGSTNASSKTVGAAHQYTPAELDDKYEEFLKLLHQAFNVPNLNPDLSIYRAILYALANLPDEVLQSAKFQKLLNNPEYQKAFKMMSLALIQDYCMDHNIADSAAWLQTAMHDLSKLGFLSDVFKVFLEQKLDIFFRQTTDVNGNRVWKVVDESGFVVEYEWKHYKALLKWLIGSGQQNNTVTVKDPMAALMTDFLKEYMRHFLEKIDACKDAGMAIMILMSMYDPDYQAQEMGLASPANICSDLINGSASPLLAFMESLKDFKASDVEGFFKAILLAKEVVKALPAMDSVAASLKDAIDGIMNTHIGKNEWSEKHMPTIGKAIEYYFNAALPNRPGTAENIAQYLRENVQSPAQGLINNAQQVGALFTGLSKQISTHLSIVTQKDDAVLKMGHSTIESIKPMIHSMVANQKTN